MGKPSTRCKMLLFVYTPCGRAHRARHTAANVHSLDGYTCQGTPSLMDGPQIKQTIPSGATSPCMEAPASAVELSSCRAVECCRGCRGLTLEWLHLMGWLYLRSIHQGRCPLTSVAIKGLPLAAVCLARCALHPGVICPRGWRSLHPCTPQ